MTLLVVRGVLASTIVPRERGRVVHHHGADLHADVRPRRRHLTFRRTRSSCPVTWRHPVTQPPPAATATTPRMRTPTRTPTRTRARVRSRPPAGPPGWTPPTGR